MIKTVVQSRALRGVSLTILFLLLFMSASARGSFRQESVGKGSAERASTARMGSMKINIVIAGKTVTATLTDNDTARDFVKLLPLKLSMNDLFGREKYAPLPRSLSDAGPRSSNYAPGDIGYWSPSHDLAIYYHQDGDRTPSPGIIPLGKLDSGVEAFAVRGSVTITIGSAKP
jgi:hypothetical protein